MGQKVSELYLAGDCAIIPYDEGAWLECEIMFSDEPIDTLRFINMEAQCIATLACESGYFAIRPTDGQEVRASKWIAPFKWFSFAIFSRWNDAGGFIELYVNRELLCTCAMPPLSTPGDIILNWNHQRTPDQLIRMYKERTKTN